MILHFEPRAFAYYTVLMSVQRANMTSLLIVSMESIFSETFSLTYRMYFDSIMCQRWNRSGFSRPDRQKFKIYAGRPFFLVKVYVQCSINLMTICSLH